MKIEYFSRDNTPQSTCLSLLHCDVVIKFLAAEDKYMTLSRVIVWNTPSLSLIVNCMVPMPSASELPATPLTPTVVDRFIVVNSSNCEHIWCVAQLSVPNSVLVGANKISYIVGQKKHPRARCPDRVHEAPRECHAALAAARPPRPPARRRRAGYRRSCAG